MHKPNLGYSPFKKSVERLIPADLEILKDVKEGWHVEYKRELVNAKSLAKSVSAFANTYGGWLFLGVAEKQKGDPVADLFPGISKTNVDCSVQRLRGAVVANLNPSPVFRPKVLYGPCDKIGLSHDSAVIAIEVPYSVVTPHVHQDGRIYRRVDDSSEPIRETDRFALDQLWRRGDRTRKKVRRWVKNDPKFSKNETNIPVLRLIFCIDPWFQAHNQLSGNVSDLRGILMETNEVRGKRSINFDSLFSIPDGILARQVGKDYGQNFGPSLRVRWNLSCDVILPLDLLHCGNVTMSNSYKFREKFDTLLFDQGHTNPSVIDMNRLLDLLIGSVTNYRKILSLASVPCEFYFKARALHVWRKIPFLDKEWAMTQFESYGIPLIQDETLQIPIGYDPQSFWPIKEFVDVKTNSTISDLQACLMFMLICGMFGLDVAYTNNSHVNALLSADERTDPVPLVNQLLQQRFKIIEN